MVNCEEVPKRKEKGRQRLKVSDWVKLRKKFWQEVVVKFHERERSKGWGKGVGTTDWAEEAAVGTVGTVEARFAIAGRVFVVRWDDVKWREALGGRGRA
jgi:hypothetical protein